MKAILSLLSVIALLFCASGISYASDSAVERQAILKKIPPDLKKEAYNDNAGLEADWQIVRDAEGNPYEQLTIYGEHIKITVVTIGEEKKELVVMGEFFGPFVPVLVGKFDKNQQLVPTKPYDLSPEEIKGLSDETAASVKTLLKKFGILTNAELSKLATKYVK